MSTGTVNAQVRVTDQTCAKSATSRFCVAGQEAPLRGRPGLSELLGNGGLLLFMTRGGTTGGSAVHL